MVHDKEPFFKRHRNAAAIAATATSAYLISDNDEERYGRFNFLILQNLSTEDILVKFDGSSTKSVRVNAGASLELIGVLTFTNIQIENLDASAQIEISEIDATIGNRIPQNEVITDTKLVIGQGSRIFDGRILI